MAALSSLHGGKNIGWTGACLVISLLRRERGVYQEEAIAAFETRLLYLLISATPMLGHMGFEGKVRCCGCDAGTLSTAQNCIEAGFPLGFFV
jgi:hypothetical protein